MKYYKSAVVALIGAVFISAGCSSGDDTSKTPKLSGDAAGKYDVNAKPMSRGGAGAGGNVSGGVSKD